MPTSNYVDKIKQDGTSYDIHDTELRNSKGQANGIASLDATGKVPSSQLPDSTDSKVTQTATTTDANYEVLFSETADNTTRTEGAGKAASLRFNPSKGALMEGSNTVATGNGSHAEGYYTTASGSRSHAEGYYTCASGAAAHAEGGCGDDEIYSTLGTFAIGENSHAEGFLTTAYGAGSHAEGIETLTNGNFSHAEGCNTIADDVYAHAEGNSTTASGNSSHAEGNSTTASGTASHAEGSGTYASGNRSHAEGFFTIASGTHSHAEGCQTTASGIRSHAEGSCTCASGKGAHAEGGYASSGNQGTFAIGEASHAEGYLTTANGIHSHAEGNLTIVYLDDSHAEGYKTTVSGYQSHAEGNETSVSGNNSHAEGRGTVVSSNDSHAEGVYTTASGEASHVEGVATLASGESSHAEGSGTTANDDYTHAEGYNTSAFGLASHAEGYSSIATHNYTHAEGFYTCASGINSHTEGEGSVTSERAAHAEGLESTASGIASHSEGYRGLASGNGAHAEGGYASAGDYLGTFATGENSHAEGYLTTASGMYSHAEGYQTYSNNGSHSEGCFTTASGTGAHAEGNTTIASEFESHAEGYKTTASGSDSHAEGNTTIASGAKSHAEGVSTKATGENSHAEGSTTTASGVNSHAAGVGTCAAGTAQTVVGRYNVADTTSFFIVGNGTSSARSNALLVASDGTTTLGASGSIASGNSQAVTGGAVYTALGNKLDASLKGAANGVAELGSDGKVPSAQLPTIPAAQIQSDYAQNDNTKLDYIKNKPTLGTAAAKDVPSSGDASTTEVVMGNDTRLTDSRNAKDVYSWAKASTKPTYTKSEVGLGNVDNTSDATKKTNFTGSIASGNTGFVTGGDAYTALSGKLNANLKGVANGVAELDSTGKVPSSQLPSFVDDVIEVDDYAHLPITGESGKIYVTKDTNKTYRWSGTAYVEISESLALGNTHSTAFYGDWGKTAYDHATETRLTTATASGFYKVASTAQGHIASLTAVTKADITALGIPAQDTTYSDATQSVHGLMSTTDKTKLDGIATGAEVNQNAFSTIGVKVGTTTTNVAADSKTDTVTLIQGSNVTLTPDATNDTITIAAKDTTYSDATTSASGLMSASDKTKLNGIASGAEVNVQSDWNQSDNTKDDFIKNKPTIPTVNNATLTIQKNGTTVKTFTANASSDVTANITVPTKVSELTNDSGYTTNTGTVTSVATGAGLTGGTIQGSGTIKAYMKSETKATYDSNTITNTQNKQYAVTPDKTGYLSVNVPWENTWRGIQNNLTSDSTSDSLSAAQGKALANGSARDNTKVAKAGDTMTGLLTTNAGITTKESITVQKKDDVAWTSSSLPAIIMKGASDRDFKFKFSTEGKNVDVGWDWTAGDGAGAFFRAADASTSPGCFGFYARQNTTTSIDFIGYPDGKLIWNSRRVVTSTNNSAVGGTTTPVYVDANGNVTALSYTIAKSVPSNADFTNTTYSLTQDASDGHKITLTPSSGTAQTITIPDNNTWRPVQNNLTSDSTTDSLSAYQGKLLNTNKVAKSGDTMTGALTLSYAASATMDKTSTNPQISFKDSGAQEVKLLYTDYDGYRAPYGLKVVGDGSNSVGAWFEVEGNLYPNKAINQIMTGTGLVGEDKGSSANPRYFPARWYFNKGISAPANGDIITIKIPCAGHDFGDFLSLDNGTTYRPITAGYYSSRLTTHYPINTPITLIYDSSGQTNDVIAAAGANARSNVTGGCWRILDFYDTGNTYDRNRWNANIKAWSTKIIGGNIIVGKDGVFHHLKEGTPFDITYPILYLGGDCNANATTTNTYDCIHFTVTTTQSMTLTAYLPVYIKGTLDGILFTPYQAACLVQTVPTSYDGYYYIELGVATSTTTIYLEHRHKILAFLNGKFGEVVNAAANWANYAASAGTASTARKIVNDTIRMTTADTAYSDAGLRYYLASSSMTTNKPAYDGQIIHAPWDTTAGWATQLCLGHGSSPKMCIRSQQEATWGSWYPVGVFTQIAPTTGQIVITDGTLGGIKSSGYTIATSVPSGAVFTDAKVTQTPDDATDSNFEVLLSGTADNASHTEGARKSSRLLYDPKYGRTIMKGPLLVQAANGVGSYDEGIRINAGKNGYATLCIGGAADTVSGTADAQFWIGTNPTSDTYKRKLFIAHAGSTASNTYFYADSASQVSPHLKVGGNITADNVTATSGIAGNTLTVTATNGTSGGISLYSAANQMDSYGIMFRKTSNKGVHGYVQADWATYFIMDSTTNRGWVYKNSIAGNVASINNAGNAVFNGSVTVGGNAANTSGARMVYDSTSKAINFEFA